MNKGFFIKYKIYILKYMNKEKELKGAGSATTMMDALQLEHMPGCICKREIVVYFCEQADCPNNKSQPYYCLFCQDDRKHVHFGVRIAKEVDGLKLKWKAFIERVSKAGEAAKNLYEPMSPLIEHLESQMQNSSSLRRNIEHPVRSITVELNSLIELGRTLLKVFEETIMPLVNEFKLIELLSLTPDFEKFE